MNRALALLVLLSVGPSLDAQEGRPAKHTTLAFTRATVIDATGAPPRSNQTVLIEGDRILAVGPADQVKVPPGAHIVDASDKYLIPGLWDMHVHWADKPSLGLYLANGVTAVRQMFGDLNQLHCRKEIEEGNLLGPRMVVASPIVDGPKPYWSGSIAVGNVAQAREAVRKIKKDGYDFVKVYSFLPRDAYLALADEAKTQGLPFAGHIPGSIRAADASAAGQKSIEHLTGVALACSSEEESLDKAMQEAWKATPPDRSLLMRLAMKAHDSYDPEKAAALFRRFMEHGTWQDPTLTVLRAMAYLDDEKFTSDPRLRYVSPLLRRMWDPKNDFRLKSMTKEDFALRRTGVKNDYKLVAAMHQAGVKFLAGTDVMNPYCFPGFSLHDELQLLVDECGFTPLEALQCATRNPAEYLGRLKDLGTVEPGKLADLVLLDANPLEKINNTLKIRAVVVSGRLLPRSELDRLLGKVESAWKERPAPAHNARTGTAPKEWTPELMMQVQDISSIQVSPDGKAVAYAARRAVMEGAKSEYRTQIFVALADGTGSYPLTQSDSSAESPQWSPDGRWIAFRSDRSGKNNVWLVRVHGGEAERLTDMKGGVGTFKWSPDGNRIAFTAVDGETAEDERRNKEKDDAREVDAHYKMNHLYVIPREKSAARKREPRRLTAGNYNVGGAAVDANPFDWSPDGKMIVFSHRPTPRVDDWTRSDISVVDVASSEVRPLVHSPAAEHSPLYSPDGKWIAFLKSDLPPIWRGNLGIQVIPADGGSPHPLAPTYNGSPTLVGWSQDAATIYYSEAYGTVTRLCTMPLDGSVRVFGQDEGVMQHFSLNASRTAVGFSYEGCSRPPEAYISRLDIFDPRPVSGVNQELADVPLSDTDVVRWKSPDGLEIEGLLTYPIHFQWNQRYPLLLLIHGGPAGVFNQRFIAAPGPYPVAVFSARGYAVLRCNPRGSTGRGRDFRQANYQDWGGNDFKDLMAGVDFQVENGIADANRLGVMGWSYGGFMTSWTITQTQRFKAASVGAGVTNLMSFNGTTDIPGFVPDYFGAEFWSTLDPYRKHSAMFQVQGVKTPTLIQHGERDERVPISQGYELYNALKRQGCPVKMVVYPRTPHGIREPRLMLDAMKRNAEWFDHYLRPESAKAKKTEGVTTAK
jgi:dipeptidyl aminopeptidase/acylaminoacyl peptidase/imidazolonepropionase-like amidohydrolase